MTSAPDFCHHCGRPEEPCERCGDPRCHWCDPVSGSDHCDWKQATWDTS